MERIDRIVNHDLFICCLNKNQEAERNRKFCRHDMAHFLDVARIGRILNEEDGLGTDVELIYAAALLHDIGRHRQYEQETPHEEASAEIAPLILKDCGFSQEETDVITDAILGHRKSKSLKRQGLQSILYRADKLSRACFACPARKECNWGDDRKNRSLEY